MGNKQKNMFWTRQNIVIAIVTGVVVVAGIITLIVWIVNNRHVSEPDATAAKVAQAEKNAKQAEADGKLRDEAEAKIGKNNTADADKLYQQAIDAEAAVERKTQLYIDLSGVYYAAGRYDEAFAAAKKAEDLNPDKFLIADWLSRLYEDRKDYVKAAEYYRLAADSAGSSQNKTAMSKAYYEAQADRVTKLQQGAK